MVSNYSIYCIPLYWVISLFPHGYGAGLIKKSNNNKWNNTNPRGIETNANYQKTVPADVWARFERAEAAHKNGMENAPFFIGAVIAGNMAGVDALTMNLVSGAVVVLRVIYNVCYINTTQHKRSFARTAVWGLSLVSLIGLYVKAGMLWVAKSG